jgi:hypothetical protein
MTPTTRVAPFPILVLSLLLLGGCCTEPERTAPSGTPEEIAGELADLAVELGAFEIILDRGADEALAASTDALTLEIGREPTEDELARVRRVLRGALAEFLTLDLWKETVVRAYAETFTAEELQAMLDFYGSSAGRRVLELQDELTFRVDDDIDAALEGHLAAFIERVDTTLDEEFSEIGEGS